MIHEALAHYSFHNPSAQLIRHNENMTYKINDDEKAYVLRIHKPTEGFNIDLLRSNIDRTDLIEDEIKLLNSLAANGIMQTQQVQLNIYGEPVTMLDNETPVTVLEWIEGQTLEKIEITPGIAHKLGVMIGNLHNELAQLSFCNRYRHDSNLLSIMIAETSNAVTQGSFSIQHAETISETLSLIRRYLADANARFIPVHTDLGKSNLIYHNGIIIPIDFSLFGYCIPEMDLASAFTHIGEEDLNQEVVKGYQSTSQLEPENAGIEICFCLQILLFVVFQHKKLAREAWFQERLHDWCEKYFVPLTKKYAI